MTRRRSILIATGNPGKLREIQAVMGDLPVEWRTLKDFPDLAEPVEDAETFAGNAALKAIHYSQLANMLALADDSGLEVDALGGQPGVRSARYAGEPADDQANNAKLIDALRSVPPEQRTARFRCAIALADGDEVLATAEGFLEGVIVDEARGDNGFGYDPHFWVPSSGMTTAQMSPAVKNAISHRGQALAALRPRLEAVIEQL